MLTDQLESLTKQCQDANANKEAMVIKYAMAEKNVSNICHRIQVLVKDIKF